jgi:hypothetical protein
MAARKPVRQLTDISDSNLTGRAQWPTRVMKRASHSPEPVAGVRKNPATES